MEFVAGVSHELRTPLTVIHTAAYNLQGKLAHNPAQVEKYGALIQRESGRLGDLVEQVLQFASATSGRVILEREPLSVETVIDETMESNRAMIEGGHCVVVKDGRSRTASSARRSESAPPGDGEPDRQCRQVWSVHIGSPQGPAHGNNWIGIFASKAAGNSAAAIEIRVSDQGPGIPALTSKGTHLRTVFPGGARGGESDSRNRTGVESRQEDRGSPRRKRTREK